MTDTSVSQMRAAAKTRRARRWVARRYARSITSIKRLHHCGLTPTGDSVGLKLSAGQAGYSGLQHCGSVWVCPVCAATIASRRAALVAEVLRRWDARGGRAVMLTLTVRHDASQPLRMVWDAVAKAWRAAISGRHWQRVESEFGVVQWLRFVEVTHGASGWHVHVHALLLLESSDVSSEAVERLHGQMWSRWDAAAGRAGLRAGVLEASEAHLVNADDGDEALTRYFTKAGYEIALSQAATKYGRRGNLTPFEMLRLLEADASGEDGWRLDSEERARLLGAWREWETGSAGRRQMTTSRGLLDALDLDMSWVPSDQEIVDADDLAGDVIVVISGDTWRRIRQTGVDLQLLEAVENPDAPGARDLIRWCLGEIPPVLR